MPVNSSIVGDVHEEVGQGALPALGIAKLSARDIMGYLVIVLLFTGIVACLGFLGWAMWPV